MADLHPLRVRLDFAVAARDVPRNRDEYAMKKLPLLRAFIDEGIVRVLDDGTIVGVAADGTEVQIGDTSHLDATEKYLQDHPTPHGW